MVKRMMESTTYSRRISFRASPQTAKRLEEIAKREDVKPAELLRRMINDAYAVRNCQK